MDLGPALISYLVEFYPANQIRGFWKQAGDALMSKSTCLIHTTQTGYEGQTSQGIMLTTAAEQTAFMDACQTAINKLEGATSIDPSRLATGIDFSRRPVMV